MQKLQGKGRETTLKDSSTPHSALYCPPLKTIGTDISEVPAQQQPFTHSGSSDNHGAQRDGGKNKQCIFDQILLLLWIAFFLIHILASSSSTLSVQPPMSLLLTPVFFCFVLYHLIVWFNSVTYGVLRGISPSPICWCQSEPLCLSMLAKILPCVFLSECN